MSRVRELIAWSEPQTVSRRKGIDKTRAVLTVKTVISVGRHAQMSKPQGGKSKQLELFARSKRPVIAIEENHRLVRHEEWMPRRSLGSSLRGSQRRAWAYAP